MASNIRLLVSRCCSSMKSAADAGRGIHYQRQLSHKRGVDVSTTSRSSPFADLNHRIHSPTPHVLTDRASMSTHERVGSSAVGDDESAESAEGERKDRKFIDRRRVVITAGNGGSGAISFMKDGGSKMRRLADGGNGGDGASVWIMALSHVKGLGDIAQRAAAENGGKGAKQGTQGKRGGKLEICVPVGTVVWKQLEDTEEEKTMEADVGNDGMRIDFSNWGTSSPVLHNDDEDEIDDNELEKQTRCRPNLGSRPRGILKGNWEMLVDLKEHGSHILLAKGGRGGKGNKSKPKGPLAGTRDLGTKGEKLTVILELKSVADIGLVGLPNAGKSTLLRAISGARPNVADYAFTTMQPQLGAVLTDGGLSSIVVADIPGLIEGAHENRGLGHNFLRHVERCSAFLFVVDLSSGIGDKPGMRPWEALAVLRAELEAYLPGLSERPALVVGTKTDIDDTSNVADELRQKTDLPVVTVSANKAKGIENLLLATEKLLNGIEKH